MSSYAITARDPERHVCRVGYDPAVDSYFLYVARPLVTDERRGKVVGDNDGHCIVWQGHKHQEIDSVEELARLLEPYATLPQGMYQTLRDDRLRRRRATTQGAAAQKG